MGWLDRLRRGRRERGASIPDGARPPGSSPSEPAPTRAKQGAGRSVPRKGSATPEPAPTLAKPPLSSPPFSEGSVVADTYEIKKLLGEGGMGAVYLAHHKGWDIDLALKVPKQEVVADPEFKRRIVTEAEAWTDLGMHPHIAYCYYVEPLGEVPLLVVEYLDGGNLRDWIAKGRCAELRPGLDLAIQFCHGLEHAHGHGLIHRDIKPENVLMTPDGTLKLTDFGIARVAAGGPAAAGAEPEAFNAFALRAARTRAGMGTAGYMAPEQWMDAHDVDARTDLFSCGVCLYELLAGGRPYQIATGPRQEPPHPGQLRGDETLPPKLCDLLRRLVDWDRERRPENAKAVRDELRAIYGEAFGEASPFADLPEVSLDADGLNNRALSYLHLGKQAEAEQAWEAALERDPHHLEATYNLGLVRWRQGQLTDEVLVRQLEALRSSRKPTPVDQYLLAQVHVERGDVDSARELLEEAARQAPEAPDVQAALRAVQSGELPANRLRWVYQGHGVPVQSLCLSEDGALVLSGNGLDHGPCVVDEEYGELRLWEGDSGKCVKVFARGPSPVRLSFLSADGRWALSVSKDKKMRLWRVATGHCVQTLEDHACTLAVCISRDARTMLSGSSDRTARLWDVTSGEYLRALEGHAGAVRSVTLSSDGDFALTGSDDATSRLWNTRDGQCARTFTGHERGVVSASLSNDGQQALSASLDGTVRVFDVATGRCTRIFRGHSRPMAQWADPSGRLVLVGTEYGPLRVLEVGSGRCVRTLHDQRQANPRVGRSRPRTVVSHQSQTGGSLRVLSVSGDKRWAASGYDRGDVCLWQLPHDPAPMCNLRPSRPRAQAELSSEQTRVRDLVRRAEAFLGQGRFPEALNQVDEARAMPGCERKPEVVAAWHKLSAVCGRGGLRAVWHQWDVEARAAAWRYPRVPMAFAYGSPRVGIVCARLRVRAWSPSFQ
jgi:serine/threonine protein kinase/WD40 repeat protein